MLATSVLEPHLAYCSSPNTAQDSQGSWSPGSCLPAFSAQHVCPAPVWATSWAQIWFSLDHRFLLHQISQGGCAYVEGLSTWVSVRANARVPGTPELTQIVVSASCSAGGTSMITDKVSGTECRCLSHPERAWARWSRSRTSICRCTYLSPSNPGSLGEKDRHLGVSDISKGGKFPSFSC